MRDKSKVAFIISIHLALFSVGAAAYGNGAGATFVFGGISTVVLAIAAFYEMNRVNTNSDR